MRGVKKKPKEKKTLRKNYKREFYKRFIHLDLAEIQYFFVVSEVFLRMRSSYIFFKQIKLKRRFLDVSTIFYF